MRWNGRSLGTPPRGLKDQRLIHALNNWLLWPATAPSAQPSLVLSGVLCYLLKQLRNIHLLPHLCDLSILNSVDRNRLKGQMAASRRNASEVACVRGLIECADDNAITFRN